ncbi:GNAT family N-acetyltransferase [Paucibacter sp. KBW04]|uniref:GNAT family N-acetyltransferase n=1 Tax=Paucibacter sp. KBW04 TaxID=2153361 RepID=UPI001E5EC187|nr:GNAT family N-acetyltransferase [Paucibacter sp. KBW04]
MVLETERLTLRQMSEADAAFMLGLLNEPSWLQNIGDRGVRTLAQARDYIRQGPMAMLEGRGFSFYIVALKGPGQTPIGMCGLTQREFLADVDLGYALLPQYCGQGYAFEAAAATLVYAKDVLKLPRVIAITRPENQVSQGLLRKLGLQWECRRPHPDGNRELDVFALPC